MLVATRCERHTILVHTAWLAAGSQLEALNEIIRAILLSLRDDLPMSKPAVEHDPPMHEAPART